MLIACRQNITHTSNIAYSPSINEFSVQNLNFKETIRKKKSPMSLRRRRDRFYIMD